MGRKLEELIKSGTLGPEYVWTQATLYDDQGVPITTFPGKGGGLKTTGGAEGQAATVTVGFQELVVDASPRSLTPVGEDVACALITFTGADIRYRSDGGAPTPTTGHLILENGIIVLESIEDINNFKAIRNASISATLAISYLALD